MHHISNKFEKSLKQHYILKWKMILMNEKKYQLKNSLQKLENKSENHFIARFKTAFFLMNRLHKSSQMKLKKASFNIIVFLMKHNQKNSRSRSSNFDGILNTQNFIGSGNSEKKYLKGNFLISYIFKIIQRNSNPTYVKSS